MKQTVLLFLINRESQEIFLIQKKRGMGQGLWNGPGGKINPGESPLEALKREAIEETGLWPLNPVLAGKVKFLFPKKNDSQEVVSSNFDNECEIYRAYQWQGIHLPETEECRSFWWPLSKIDFAKFWPDDQYWMPSLIGEKYFEREYRFDHNQNIVNEKVII